MCVSRNAESQVAMLTNKTNKRPNKALCEVDFQQAGSDPVLCRRCADTVHVQHTMRRDQGHGHMYMSLGPGRLCGSGLPRQMHA